jgi:hypothetical protein
MRVCVCRCRLQQRAGVTMREDVVAGDCAMREHTRVARSAGLMTRTGRKQAVHPTKAGRQWEWQKGHAARTAGKWE